ncbi:MAG TPA: glutamine-hydrolyzing GMP synthase [Candidatus Hydrogenedens sp.]|nr:glutamine-hydrolyzing GMP synthase [Candidatus Hydrogenedens sp.]HOL20390.1 glutamine-hydrolyzing GMP synthase [Candidatus Hydrogenedens sp.]HPP58895.1 glutamine-hydrolyzing GMP synthase [Candidatus Hydrogenedens sp.]
MEYNGPVIVVLDFGAQYSKLIARRIRESGVYSIILPYNTSLEKIKSPNLVGLVLSGGPASVHQPNAPLPNPEIFKLNVPILGICYGVQIFAHLLGGKVEPATQKEYGIAYLKHKNHSELLKGIHKETPVWMSHGDHVTELPPGFTPTGATANCRYAVIENYEQKFYGVQFHPEVVHTPEGQKIISNFVHNICKADSSWTMGNFITHTVQELKERINGKKVLCALSGGVDSSVTAVLLHRAIGDNLHCVFVDNGLLRKGEPEMVEKIFRDNFHINLHCVKAQDLFLNQLKGVTEPEQKRKIIGSLFIDVFEKEAKKLGDLSFLAQGTLYPDVIESVSATGGPSSTIKSHHNVGGLPEKMNLQLIEPLRELFKDEVRDVGKQLGIPEEIIHRHPFPGPGLAVRCIGEVTEERLNTLREADAIFIEEIRKAGLYNQIWQAFVCLLPVKSVGVQGDERTYKEVCVLRAVTSEDAMTADWFRFPHDVIQKVASRICNEVHGINRVLIDVTSKPPATIEWE